MRRPADDGTSPERESSQPRGDVRGGMIGVDGMPFIAQRAVEESGAAALAMVFAFWHVAATLDDVLLEAASERGSEARATTLRDIARRRGLPAFVVRGEVADLVHEFALRRPVLVGLRAPTHYELVIGIDRSANRIVTLDPAHGTQRRTVDDFLEDWEAGERSAIVFHEPPESRVR